MDELIRIRHLYEEIQSQEDYCEQLRTMVESPHSAQVKQDFIQSDLDVHRNEKIILELTDAENKLQDLRDQYSLYVVKVMQKINMLQKDLQRKILKMRYLDFKTLMDISEELGYSYDHIKRTHRIGKEEYNRLSDIDG